MDFFARVARYNAWANERVLAAAAEASLDQLESPLLAEDDTILSRLRHTAGTEEAFVHVLRGAPERPNVPATLAAIRDHITAQDAILVGLCRGLEDEALVAPRLVPWFKRMVPVQDCLIQVLNHSGQHRAEIALELGRLGIDTGDLDYIDWWFGGLGRQ